VGGSGNPCRADGGGDGQGHGTWVASVIASQTDNGAGIAGVAPDAKILAIRAISPDGTGSVEDISAGIRFAAAQGAKVINLSVGPDVFGKPFPSLECPPSVVGGCLTPPITDAASLHRALQPAVDYAAARGALVVVAAGNTDPGSSPGPSLYLGMQNLLIVGATGPHDEAATYSDTGSGPTFVWAPGGNGSCSSGDTSNCIILASMHGGYQVSEGTSFATPHVSGVAALLVANGYSASAAAGRIVSSADQVQAGARLDAAAAVGASSAPAAPNPPAAAPAARPSRPVVAPVTARPAASPTPSPPPSPTPSPTPPPGPIPSVTAPVGPTPKVEAAGLAARHRAAHRGLASRVLGSNSPGSAAVVLFLAATCGSGAVWLVRRLHV